MDYFILAPNVSEAVSLFSMGMVRFVSLHQLKDGQILNFLTANG